MSETNEEITRDRKLLKDVVERWYEMQTYDATRHDFACLIYSIEDHLAAVLKGE